MPPTTTRFHKVDGRYPTMNPGARRSASGLFIEDGAGTYQFNIPFPAYAVLEEITISQYVVWNSAGACTLEIGDYTTAATPVAIDADGFITAVDLKTMPVGQTLRAPSQIIVAPQGAYAATAGIWLQASSATDRILRAQVVVASGTGANGRTAVQIKWSNPEIRNINKPSSLL